MDLRAALITALKASGPVTALIGSGDGARVYWLRRDQGSALPALTLRVSGGAGEDPDLMGDADYQESRVQGSCLAKSYKEARALAKAFADTLMDLDEVGDMQFWEGTKEAPIDLGSFNTEGTYTFEVSQDVLLTHTPSA